MTNVHRSMNKDNHNLSMLSKRTSNYNTAIKSDNLSGSIKSSADTDIARFVNRERPKDDVYEMNLVIN